MLNRAICVTVVLLITGPLASIGCAQRSVESAGSADERAFEVSAELFGARMKQMRVEMLSAVTAAAGDQKKLSADLDIIVERYQPDVYSFSSDLDSIWGKRQMAAPAEKRAEIARTRSAAVTAVRTLPSNARMQILEAQPQGRAP